MFGRDSGQYNPTLFFKDFFEICTRQSSPITMEPENKNSKKDQFGDFKLNV